LAVVPSNDSVAPSIDEIERVYRQSYQRFYRLARAYTLDDESAVDAVQEAFARAIRNRMAFRGDAGFETWLWRTLVNLCVDEQRRSRHVVDGESPSHVEIAHSNGAGPGHEWLELRAAVAALPKRQRLILFLRHYGDLDYESIAAIAEVERGTVAATLNRAHRSLRRTLTEVAR
jgi:RNA polymerase sigma-70 factor (ECF subfamily)